MLGQFIKHPQKDVVYGTWHDKSQQGFNVQ